jgi:hypothetical protein
LVRLLRPFKEVTDRLQGSATTTISSIWPDLTTLFVLSNTPEVPFATPTAKYVAFRLVKSLVIRFQIHEVNDSNSTCVVASLLDPRFKRLLFLTNDSQRVVWRYLSYLYNAEVESQAAAPVTLLRKNRYGTTSLTSSRYWIGERSSGQSPNELAAYDSVSAVAEETLDPLQWWGMHEKQFPVLSRLAARILSIPASSAPAERIFSVMAGLNRKQRSLLNPVRLGKLTFSKHNLSALKALGIDLAAVFGSINLNAPPCDENDDDDHESIYENN